MTSSTYKQDTTNKILVETGKSVHTDNAGLTTPIAFQASFR